jgi:hypothetical protein
MDVGFVVDGCCWKRVSVHDDISGVLLAWFDPNPAVSSMGVLLHFSAKGRR